MTLAESFKQAVEADLGQGSCQPGLQALKAADRKLVQLSNPRDCHGSADIDSSLQREYPNDPRWDYVLAHGEKLHYVEVHPAHTSEVQTMQNKHTWLKQWLKQAKLGQLKASVQLHWVASGKVAILPGSKQARKAVMMGLEPKPRLHF